MQKAPPPPPPGLRPNPTTTTTTTKPTTSTTTKAPAYFSESELPSCKLGGFTIKEERTTRRKTCRFLEEAGRVLKLPRVTISTSMVFFHRFYAVHSFKDHDRFEVAVACLLLAAKTEESPKKLVSVIQECFRLKHLSSKKSMEALAKEGIEVNEKGYLDGKCREFYRLKERILLLERVILHTIGFELSISHPYIHFGKIKTMISSRQLEYIEPSASSTSSSNTFHEEFQNMMKELTQSSMNFANDSMHTSLCLQYPPKTIAYACIYLGGQFCKLRPADKKQWLDILDLSMVDLATIVLQIMELIADKKGIDQDLFKSISADLDRMKKEVEGAAGHGHGNGNGGQHRLPPVGERDPKRPRI